MNTTLFKNNKSTNKTTTNCFGDFNYSKLLDKIIKDNILKTNKYLGKSYDDSEKDFINNLFANNKSTKINLTSSFLKDENDFIKAAKFLSNYNKNYKKFPFKFETTYKLIDGTTIIFYDDEIQIGCDTYTYDDFEDFTILSNIPPKTKKTIIDIYIKSINNISISIN